MGAQFCAKKEPSSAGKSARFALFFERENAARNGVLKRSKTAFLGTFLIAFRAAAQETKKAVFAPRICVFGAKTSVFSAF
ncbi:MAG: hypothetical protein IJD75_01725 [Clostridia bacterium]|nr:hypothetical protein [Clostridia bacterium]